MFFDNTLIEIAKIHAISWKSESKISGAPGGCTFTWAGFIEAAKQILELQDEEFTEEFQRLKKIAKSNMPQEGETIKEFHGSNKELTVKLTYFKKSGKFYDVAEFQAYADWDLHSIWHLVRKLREEGRLPGLVDGAGREFMILVDVPGHRHEHPHLIV